MLRACGIVVQQHSRRVQGAVPVHLLAGCEGGCGTQECIARTHRPTHLALGSWGAQRGRGGVRGFACALYSSHPSNQTQDGCTDEHAGWVHLHGRHAEVRACVGALACTLCRHEHSTQLTHALPGPSRRVGRRPTVSVHAVAAPEKPGGFRVWPAAGCSHVRAWMAGGDCAQCILCRCEWCATQWQARVQWAAYVWWCVHARGCCPPACAN